MENSNLAKGYMFALITVLIWSGWIIVSRLGATQHLTALDMTFLRHGPAGLIMAPLAWKHRKLINKKTWQAMIIMLIGAGPLYLLCTSNGFLRAPASHGVLTPCSMTLFVAIMTFYFLREKITKIRYLGYALILAGVIFKFAVDGASSADFYFLAAGFLWATYTVQNKKTGIDPIAITAFICTGSAILLIIPFILSLYIDPHPMPLGPVLIQGIYQCIFTAIISFITYNRAVALIGAGRASSFAALIPVLVIILSMPILSEYPNHIDLIFAAFMSAGVFLASGVVRFVDKKAEA